MLPRSEGRSWLRDGVLRRKTETIQQLDLHGGVTVGIWREILPR
jgi:hypothetical protein